MRGMAHTHAGLLWDWLESVTPGVVRGDVSTYSEWPEHVEGGILPYFGSGHSRFAWHVRSKPKVRQAFAQVGGGVCTYVCVLAPGGYVYCVRCTGLYAAARRGVVCVGWSTVCNVRRVVWCSACRRAA